MGKASRIPSATDRIRKHHLNLKTIEAEIRNRDTPKPVMATRGSGRSGAGATGGGTGNFLSTEGGAMIGAFALNPPVDFSVEIDANNAIDIGRKDTNQQFSSNIQFEDIQPNTFTLDTIIGAAYDGQILVIRTFAPNSPFTIAAGTLGNGGNIQTPTGSDITGIGDLQMIFFVFDEALKIEANTGGSWRLLNTFGGGGAAQTPWLQQIEGAGFTLNQAGKIVIKPIQTDGLQGILELERNDTTPTDNDIIGQILFNGPDVGDNVVTWGAIEIESDDVTVLAKQGQYKVSVMHDNALAPIMNYTGADGIFRFSSGVDVVRPNINGTMELGTVSFFWDDVFTETLTLRGSGGNTDGTARTVYADAAGMIFNMPSGSAVFTHSVNNSIFSLLTNGDLELRTDLQAGFTLRLRNNDLTPINSSVAGTILFLGNDVQPIQKTYGSIEVDMDVVTQGLTQANMFFRIQESNSIKTFMNFLGASNKINMFSFLDINSNFIEFDDRTDPGATTATERRLFSDSNNNAHLTIRTNTGLIDLEAAGAAGANTALSNLTSPTAINQNLIPTGSVSLGSIGAATTWDDAYIASIHAVSRIEFLGTDEKIIDIGSTMAWDMSAGLFLRTAVASPVTFMELEQSGITVIRRGNGAFNPGLLNLQNRSVSPADNDFVGHIQFQGNNSSASLITFAEIIGLSQDVSPGTEDGTLKFNVRNAGAGIPPTVIEIGASGGNVRLGFFGVAPVVRQNPATTATAIRAALVLLGLFV